MGLLWRLFVPRPVKKARRALHPGRVVVRAVTPRSVKRIRRATFGITHPFEAVESAIINSVARPSKRSHDTRRYSANRESVIGRSAFVYVCRSCGREFAHLKRNQVLRPHNDRSGRACVNRKGKLKEIISL